jgi:isoleucyl-tRNA synthetase
MSKSLGNTIEPEKIIKQYGAEVLRLWIASVEYNEDVRLSETILQRIAEAYRKLRNTFRYALGNLADFDPAADTLPGSELLEVDQWILTETDELVEKCRRWYAEFAFHKVYRAIYDFATINLSAVYFDISKDRLYTASPRGRSRRSAQTALYRINYALVRLLAPLMSFTTEEAWSHMKKPAGAPGSVHLSLLPEPGEVTEGLSQEAWTRAANWKRLMEVRDAVLKELENKRQEKFIGAPLEARVTLAAGGDLYSILARYAEELPGLFIVSEVALTNQAAGPVRVTVERATGTKCERCWKYTHDVGSDGRFPSLCRACSEAVTDILG